MARKKFEPSLVIRDLDHADEVLQQLGEVGRGIKTIEIQMNAAIDAAREEAAKRSAPLIQVQKELEAAIAAYGTTHKEELFRQKRSIELTFGSIGFRLSTKLAPLKGLTWKQVFGRIKNLGFLQGIRVKEEIDKDNLQTWSDDRLTLVGIRKVQTDSFWIETKEEAVPAEGKARVAG